MKLPAQKASWFVSGMVVFAVVWAGVEVVVAQPGSEPSRPVLDRSEATLELLGENKFVNIDNIAYTSDEGGVFDVFFACSSSRSEDPLRLIGAKEMMQARSYFNDEKRYAKRFLKFSKYCIGVRHISYIESQDNSIIVRFNARISDAFVGLTLSGTDAESFRKAMRVF